MAITSQDKLIAALASGYTFVFPPLYMLNPSIYNLGTHLGLTTSWVASSRPGLVPSAGQIRTPITCGASTAGAMPLPALTAGNRYYLGSITHGGMAATTIMILDRLAMVRIDPTSLAAQTLNLTLPARATTAVGVLPFFEILASDATGTLTMPVTNITYTNSSGVSGRGTAGHTLGPTASGYERQPGGILPFALAAGDRGVQSIQTVTMGEQMSSGMIVALSLCRVVYANHQYAQAYNGQQLGFYDLGGIDLGTDPCLFYGASSASGSGTTAPPTVIARIIQG